MSHSTQPTASQIRDLYRLIGDVRALHGDRMAQRRLLVDGACALLGADEGFFTHFANWGRGQVPREMATLPGSVIDQRVAHFTERFYRENVLQADAMGAALYDATADRPTTGALAWSDVRKTYTADNYPRFYELTRTVRLADILDPVMRDSTGNIVVLSLHRIGPASRVFSARHKKLASMLAEELKWLHETGRLNIAVVLSEPVLSPRLREVYDLLLTDLSAKQIARKLNLSIHTVREYIQGVYRAVGVSGRSELMARHLARQ